MAKPKTYLMNLTLADGSTYIVKSLMKIGPDYANAQVLTECGKEFVIPVSDISGVCSIEEKQTTEKGE